MKCEICNSKKSEHTIQGWDVCADNYCKYVAWQWTPKELRGQRGGGNNSGNAADPRPHDNDQTTIDE